MQVAAAGLAGGAGVRRGGGRRRGRRSAGRRVDAPAAEVDVVPLKSMSFHCRAAVSPRRIPCCLCMWGMAGLDRFMGDTTITKVDSTHSPRGPLGQTYLATGVGVGMR